ncbi:MULTISPECIES: aromatic alcohol reductase [unclassified Pseudomonas]|uniref:aromatic alcohol reductase n=1 Tax=unclassified Pseudomonas TaxID=196821 RepID=UPI0020980DA4|nr:MULTISPECIES: aromatic alcohol reductase [unclassified Pseudomonas]MCO7519070.1 aromatic alcohol reductase [Pseudomonas sp. 1]MCO7539905.1 aromatic alcohol reductase [Pseudomonas sp. VA159-2]
MTEATPLSPQSILVLGAGELGFPVLRNLVRVAKRAPGSQISVLLRESTINTQIPEKKAEIDELRGLGIQMVAADLVNDSIEKLAEVFARFDTVIGCAGMVAGRETPMKLATAALRSGVKRYFPWQFGVDFEVIGRGSPQDLFDSQLDVREALRAQDKTEWVIISTGMFTSFLFEPVFEVVDFDNDTVNALGSLENSVTLTTPDDIGALTAEIVFFEPRFRNEIVYLSGDTVSYGQVANILEHALGRPFKTNVWTVPFLMDELRKDPTHHIKKYRAVFAQGRGVAWPKAGTFNEQRSIPATTAEQWAQANLRVRVKQELAPT